MHFPRTSRIIATLEIYLMIEKNRNQFCDKLFKGVRIARSDRIGLLAQHRNPVGRNVGRETRDIDRMKMTRVAGGWVDRSPTDWSSTPDPAIALVGEKWVTFSPNSYSVIRWNNGRFEYTTTYNQTST